MNFQRRCKEVRYYAASKVIIVEDHFHYVRSNLNFVRRTTIKKSAKGAHQTTTWLCPELGRGARSLRYWINLCEDLNVKR